MCFHKNCFFHYFKWNLGGLGVSGGRGWTIRRDCLELWQGLVLQDMGEVDFHVFCKYWKLISSPNDPWTSRWVLGFFLNTRGFWMNGLRRKSILKNDHPKQIFYLNLGSLPEPSFFEKNGFFSFAFVGPHAFFFDAPEALLLINRWLE